MYPFYAFHLRGKKGASLGLSLPGLKFHDGQSRRSWDVRSTLSSKIIPKALGFQLSALSQTG